MVLSKHLPGDLMNWEDLTRANFGLVDVHTLAKEKLMGVLNSLVAGTKQALVFPKSLKVAVADPLGSMLLCICERRLETVSLWQVFL